jgi:hypothetical protein
MHRTPKPDGVRVGIAKTKFFGVGVGIGIEKKFFGLGVEVRNQKG